MNDSECQDLIRIKCFPGLVPGELAGVLRGEFEQHNVVMHEKASHAPFISHQDDFIRQLLDMAQRLRSQ